MKKITLLFVYLMLFGFGLNAQNKQLSIQDAVVGQWRDLYPKHLMGLQPYGENDFTYVEDYSKVYKIDGKTGEAELLFTLKDFNEIIKKSGKVKTPYNYFPYWSYSWTSDGLLQLADDSYRLFDIKNKKELVNISNDLPYANMTVAPSNKMIAATMNDKFFINDGNKNITIAEDEEGIVNGSAYVHREEFGINKGSFWSPDGKKLAFYRKDESMVADYPLVDITQRIAKKNNLKYPMIGEKSEEVQLGIYDLNSKKTVYANVTDFTAERYLTAITWGAESKYVYIAVLNRDQNHLKLNKYDAETGKLAKTLLEEKNSRYVEPEHPLYFVPNHNNQFIWFSERDGYNHLYLYDTDGNLISQITKGDWVVTNVEGFDEKGQNLYFTATKDSPIENNYYKVNLKNKKITKLTQGKGTHEMVFSNSKKYMIDTYSSTTVPNKSTLLTAKGKVVKTLIEAENTLADYNLGKMTISTIKSADGKTDLYYRMITPPNFDPKKKYPVIVYVYGGPHAQLVTNSWLGGASLWNQYMAQKGYIMFTIDNRGSDNRGFEFESIIHRQCGVAEMQDQMKGIEFLLKKPYVDKDRIGVHGWSYGGFMTTSLIVDHPETFKVAVAGGPVIDWKYYEVMYGERYMDTPATNPKGFEKTSLLNKAGKLKGRLLIIHGYQDPVVVPQHSIDFIRSCIKSNTDIDYFLYPESEHNVRGMKRIHLMRKITRYFDDYL